MMIKFKTLIKRIFCKLNHVVLGRVFFNLRLNLEYKGELFLYSVKRRFGMLRSWPCLIVKFVIR